jgi:cytoskeletal protein RodZ
VDTVPVQIVPVQIVSGQTASAQQAFVERLRRYREQSGITLGEVAAQTRVKPELLEAFERNDVSVWPLSMYARGWIQVYASALGLDPIDTASEFLRLFPAPALTFADTVAPAQPRGAGARRVTSSVRSATAAVLDATRFVRTRVVGFRPTRALR